MSICHPHLVRWGMSEIAHGYCQCGCGERTNLAPYTSRTFGWRKGEPLKFINGHARRRPRTHVIDPETGCWVWQGYTRPDGYGVLRINERMTLAHRWSYERLIGPIPEGLHIDHLCRNRACVNPDHLEPVLNEVNVMRGMGLTARNAEKTHCDYGHPFEGDNLYVSPKGWRYCRECNRRRDRERRRAA